MSYVHWNCECGANGYSNDRQAGKVIIDRHRFVGHTVTVWIRGHRDRAEKWAAFTPPGDK